MDGELLDDCWTLLVQKLVTAIRTEELDLFVPELMPMTIKIAFALGTGNPKNFRHDPSPLSIRLSAFDQSARAG
jgi:hypothetical protein